MRKNIEEILMGFVAEWRNREYIPDIYDAKHPEFRNPMDVVASSLADELEEFVKCNPTLHGIEVDM